MGSRLDPILDLVDNFFFQTIETMVRKCLTWLTFGLSAGYGHKVGIELCRKFSGRIVRRALAGIGNMVHKEFRDLDCIALSLTQ